MNELHLPVCALFFAILLCIVFYSKKRLKLIENKIFSVMLITSLLDSIIIIIERLCVSHGNIELVSNGIKKLLTITNKLDFGILIIHTTCAFLYTLIITYPSIKEKIKKIIKTTIIVDCIFYIIILFLNVNLISNNNIISVDGGAIIITYILCGLYLLLSVLIAIINITKLTKRHIPIMSAIFIFAFLIYVFTKNPYIMVISITIVFVNYIMYFTIQNPDIKMLEELSKAKDIAEKYNNDKSLFVFNMTQQIKYPLNVIEQRAEQLMLLKDKSINELAYDIKYSSQKISNLINVTLNIDAIDINKIRIVENKYNIKNLLSEIVIKAEEKTKQKNLKFLSNIDKSLPHELYGDSIRLKQIISSIVENAIKYTDEGIIELNVNSTIENNTCRLMIIIGDSGNGISIEAIDKMSSNQNDAVERVNDKELTLETIKKIVNIIGGTITIENKKRKGTEITIIIDQTIEQTAINKSNEN